MATDKPRFSVTFTDDSYTKIQKYKEENKISTKSKAVAKLVEIALKQIESEINKESPTVYESTPADLFTSIEQQYGIDAHNALFLYVQLDQDDRGEIRGEMKHMLKADKYKGKTADVI